MFPRIKGLEPHGCQNLEKNSSGGGQVVVTSTGLPSNRTLEVVAMGIEVLNAKFTASEQNKI